MNAVPACNVESIAAAVASGLSSNWEIASARSDALHDAAVTGGSLWTYVSGPKLTDTVGVPNLAASNGTSPNPSALVG